jgi:hypothetical protein
MTGQAADEQFLVGPASLALYEGIVACQSTDQLDAMARLIWERYGCTDLGGGWSAMTVPTALRSEYFAFDPQQTNILL